MNENNNVKCTFKDGVKRVLIGIGPTGVACVGVLLLICSKQRCQIKSLKKENDAAKTQAEFDSNFVHLLCREYNHLATDYRKLKEAQPKN